MEQIIFKNTGIYRNIFNENLKISEELSIDKTINHYYNNNIVFDKDLTLEGFLYCLSLHKDMIDEDFISYTRGFLLDVYLSELNKPITKLESDISYIEFYHTNVINKTYNIEDDTYENDHEQYSSYHGINPDPSQAPWGLSFTNLQNIKHLNIKLLQTYNIDMIDFTGDDGITTNKIATCEKYWTVFEVISSYLTELTFYGYPSDAEKLSNELESRDYDIEETVSWEEVQLEWLEEDLKRFTLEEKFEACERVKKEILKLKNDNKEDK